MNGPEQTGWGYEPGEINYHRVLGGPERTQMTYSCGKPGPTAAAHLAPLKAGLPNDGFGGHSCAACYYRLKERRGKVLDK